MSTHWFCFYFQEREKKFFSEKFFFQTNNKVLKWNWKNRLTGNNFFYPKTFAAKKTLILFCNKFFFWQNLFFWTTFEHLHGQFSVQNFSVSSHSNQMNLAGRFLLGTIKCVQSEGKPAHPLRRTHWLLASQPQLSQWLTSMKILGQYVRPNLASFNYVLAKEGSLPDFRFLGIAGQQISIDD